MIDEYSRKVFVYALERVSYDFDRLDRKTKVTETQTALGTMESMTHHPRCVGCCNFPHQARPQWVSPEG